MNNLKTRIPKIFSPIKYTISLYIDILSLNYTIEEEIKIISESDNSPYLILNAHLSYLILFPFLYKNLIFFQMILLKFPKHI